MTTRTAPEPSQGAPVAVLDQVLWRDLLTATTAAAFGEAWLGLACRLVTGAASGVLLLAQGQDGEPAPVAAWPQAAYADAPLRGAADHAIRQGRGLVQAADGDARQPLRLAYPIQIDDRIAGAVALACDPAAAGDPRDSMRQLQWAVAWVRDFIRRDEAVADRSKMRRAALALELLASALEEEGFTAACRVAATELATRLDCKRVTFGYLRHHRARIVCISHSAQFGKRMKLVRQLAAAMDEAIDQQAVVLYPPLAEEHLPLTWAHEALSADEGGAQVLTVPMFVKDRFVGAVTFERDAAMPFDQPTVDIAEAVAAILGPALVDKHDNDRWLVVKALHALGLQARRLLGPGHLGRKLALVVILAATAFGFFATGRYDVVANGQVEGAVRRSLSAPFDGFIGEASARAGDLVRRDEQLASLDNRDLTLERLRWVTERQQHLYEYDQALGKRERADALKFQSLVDQADAEIHLADEQLARSRVLAPFDGIVVSGDLTQSIGAAVHRGDVLFEVAPLEGYRVELRIHESQIADVKPGQTGELVLAALPSTAFPFVVERITPVATVRDGNTFFQVDGNLLAASDRLRPGMEGVGKIDAGTQRLAWIWTRSMLHWLRLFTWRWLP